MILDDYIVLFSGSNRNKDRFMALAEAVLQQVIDLQAAVPDVAAAFMPDSASGAQLDMVGESLGLSRTDCNSGAGTSDADFRDYIKKKLILWSWDGTLKMIPELMNKIKSGSRMTDNGNGTVSITGVGTQPAPLESILPVTAGVRIV